MKEHRINARLPESLAHHVEEMCGSDGYYDSASEYIRDLVRHDLEKVEQEKSLRLKTKLATLINRPIEECLPFEPEKELEELEKQYLAQKETQK